MGVFGAVLGCRGDAGFSGSLLGASSGGVGFNVAALSRLVRDILRPAWSDGGRERDKVRPARSKWPKFGVFALVGRVLLRKRCWRGSVGCVFSRSSSCRCLRANFITPWDWHPGPSTGSLNPLMRRQTHLLAAGHYRPRSTRWVNVRVSGPRRPPAGFGQPPVGFTCALKG